MNVSKLMVGTAVAMLLMLGATQNGVAGMSSEQRLSDYTQLVNIIERHYGPLLWKRTSISLDWKRTVDEFRGKVLSAKSDSEFHRMLAQFLATLQDAHVSSIIPSNYKASLGFACDLVEGKALIETIDRLRLPEVLFPFKKGDQVISIGNVPVAKIAEELSLVTKTGDEMSTKRIAYARLTTRREAVGVAVPKGITTITILPKGAATPVTVTATWLLSGTPLVELDDLSETLSGAAVVTQPMAADVPSLMNKLAKMSMFNLTLPESFLADLKSGISDMGAMKSMFKLPEGAKVYEDIAVTAAVYEVAGKKIGILRIPSYSEDGLPEVLARALVRMEKETDVLVLDQTNNPGGSVSQVSDIISLFADRTYQDMNFEVRPSLAWLKGFQDVNEEINGLLKANPENMEANALQARFQYLESEIRGALVEKRFSTAPFSLNYLGSYGVIQPAGAVRYTKPVLLLINELDFSGGDAFPALMKDNGRVTIFGTATTGAGGNVREYGPLANSFFKLHLTESLMVRPNGEYMENRGIRPDIEYAMTEDDFMNGYRNYVKRFTAEALKLTGMTQEQIDATEKK